MTAASLALVVSVFAACFVEMVEATTIVMAMGSTRSWRSTLMGAASALVVLAAFTATLGYALVGWIPESALQLLIGSLLLVFGLQWLRKAIFRSAGLKAIHDEAEIFEREVASARAADRNGGPLDLFSFVVSFKAVFLEGMEVVFIVITFGLNAHGVPLACVGAVAAVALVLVVAVLIRRPLSMIDENLLKYIVGLLLATFGTFWSLEGIGLFDEGRRSLSWPGGEVAVLVVLGAWFLVSRVLIKALTPEQGEVRWRRIL